MSYKHRASCECGADIPLKLLEIIFTERIGHDGHLNAECMLILDCEACDRVHQVTITNLDPHNIPKVRQPVE